MLVEVSVVVVGPVVVVTSAVVGVVVDVPVVVGVLDVVVSAAVAVVGQLREQAAQFQRQPRRRSSLPHLGNRCLSETQVGVGSTLASPLTIRP